MRGLMNAHGTSGGLLRRYAEFVHVTSPDLVREFLRAIERPRVRRWLGSADSPSYAERTLEIIRRAEVVTPATIVPICRDESDDKLFACAVGGAADYIVSEDEDVLAIEEYAGVRTLRASGLLRMLDAAR